MSVCRALSVASGGAVLSLAASVSAESFVPNTVGVGAIGVCGVILICPAVAALRLSAVFCGLRKIGDPLIDFTETSAAISLGIVVTEYALSHIMPSFHPVALEPKILIISLCGFLASSLKEAFQVFYAAGEAATTVSERAKIVLFSVLLFLLAFFFLVLGFPITR